MKTSSVKKQFIDTQVHEFRERDPVRGELLNKHHRVLELVAKYAHKEAYILDVGCSDGKILQRLEKLGYENLYGVDIQEISAHSFENSSIHYAACDIENDSLPYKHKFDLIIFSDVLEHLFSPQTVLYHVRNNLKSNGYIVFSVPNAGWFLNGLLLTFFPSKLFISTAFGPWGHTYQFTSYHLKRIAKNLKLKLVGLTGGKMDNYAFKTGAKKVVFDTLMNMGRPFIKLWPSVFSAHLFGAFQRTEEELSSSSEFDVGV